MSAGDQQDRSQLYQQRHRVELLGKGVSATLEYRLVRLISQGGYSSVYLAETFQAPGSLFLDIGNSARPIVVKRILSHGRDIRLSLAALHGELLALDINHQYINRPLGICHLPHGWDIIYERPFELTLDALRQTLLFMPSEERQRLIFETSVPLTSFAIRALAACGLRSPSIQHGDWKPLNILLNLHHSQQPSHKPRMVLSDFGLAFVLNEGEVLTAAASRGTAGYVPPEALVPNGAARYLQSDCYSMALVILFWIYGRVPDQEMVELASYLEDVPPAVGAILANCLNPTPQCRPSFRELVALDPIPSDRDSAMEFCDMCRASLTGVKLAGFDQPLLGGLFDIGDVNPLDTLTAAHTQYEPAMRPATAQEMLLGPMSYSNVFNANAPAAPLSASRQPRVGGFDPLGRFAASPGPNSGNMAASAFPNSFVQFHSAPDARLAPRAVPAPPILVTFPPSSGSSKPDANKSSFKGPVFKREIDNVNFIHDAACAKIRESFVEELQGNGIDITAAVVHHTAMNWLANLALASQAPVKELLEGLSQYQISLTVFVSSLLCLASRPVTKSMVYRLIERLIKYQDPTFSDWLARKIGQNNIGRVLEALKSIGVLSAPDPLGKLGDSMDTS